MTDSLEDYTEHRELVMNRLNGKRNYGEPILIKEEDFHFIHMHREGPQVCVMESLDLGPREVDTFMVVGFYIPHDGQCTVAINHMDQLITVDNADPETA